VVLRALERDPGQRHESALAMAAALESCVRPASVEATAGWVSELARESLEARARLVLDAESETSPSQRRPALSSAQALEPTVLASQAPGPPASDRDGSPAGASKLAGSFGHTVLKLFAMAAGVSLVWFVGERLWPRAVPPARVAEAEPSSATPAAPLAPSAQQQGPLGRERAEVAPRERGVGSTSGVALPHGPRTVTEKAALRPDPARSTAPRASTGGAAGSAGAAGLDCSPPFSLDTEGIRHMKPGCK
jgi:hypothetical protein